MLVYSSKAYSGTFESCSKHFRIFCIHVLLTTAVKCWLHSLCDTGFCFFFWPVLLIRTAFCLLLPFHEWLAYSSALCIFHHRRWRQHIRLKRYTYTWLNPDHELSVKWQCICKRDFLNFQHIIEFYCMKLMCNFNLILLYTYSYR